MPLVEEMITIRETYKNERTKNIKGPEETLNKLVLKGAVNTRKSILADIAAFADGERRQESLFSICCKRELKAGKILEAAKKHSKAKMKKTVVEVKDEDVAGV